MQDQELYARVEKALDTVRPHLRVDGGDVELINITEDGVVEVKWLGSCESCKMSVMTLRAGLEEAVKNQVPQIKMVRAVNGVGLDVG